MATSTSTTVFNRDCGDGTGQDGAFDSRTTPSAILHGEKNPAPPVARTAPGGGDRTGRLHPLRSRYSNRHGVGLSLDYFHMALGWEKTWSPHTSTTPPGRPARTNGQNRSSKRNRKESSVKARTNLKWGIQSASYQDENKIPRTDPRTSSRRTFTFLGGGRRRRRNGER